MAEVLVRGRDFTGWRIAGAALALVFGAALAWQIVELVDGDSVVQPTSGWGAARVSGESAAEEGFESLPVASEILRARTTLQDERFRSGPSPGAEAPDIALGPGQRLVESPIEGGGRDLPGDWARADGEVLSLLRADEETIGVSSLPYPGANIFERPFAREWRTGLADIVTHIGAIAMLGVLFLLSSFMALRGRIPITRGRSGETVRRFGLVERVVHWIVGVSFIWLAITGIVLGFGVSLLLPILGGYALGQVGWVAAWSHIAMGLPFALGTLAMIPLWIRYNMPGKQDLEFLAAGGGFWKEGSKHPSAHKFNAGQKIVFWSATIGGLLLVLTGVGLMFPGYVPSVPFLGWTMLIHALVGVLMIALFFGHIYIGSVGMQGGFDAMWSGEVDANWAAEHHDLWFEELKGRGAAPRQLGEAPGREGTRASGHSYAAQAAHAKEDR